MECPECGEYGFRKTCKGCGYSNEKKGKYPTISGRMDTIISRDCMFTTGTWTCQWGAWASDKEKKIYCPFHRDILMTLDRHSDDSTFQDTQSISQLQWEQFLKDRDWYQKSGYSWAYPDGTYPKTPFWFKPVEEAWKMLTGLPVPV